MKKKVLAMILVMLMTVGLLGCGGSGGSSSGGSAKVSGKTKQVEIDGIKYNKATDLTKDKISLTYFTFDQKETDKYLADRFTKIYPNIKVNVVYKDVGKYDDTLLTLVSNHQSPDVIMYSDADFALGNYLLKDISGYWNSDPETKEIASTINDLGIGCFGTKARYAVPVKFFPGVMFVDRNVLQKLNVKAPSMNWTWDDMIKLIKECTVKKSSDDMTYYGCGYYNRLDSYYGIAAAQNIKGEFGFNGTNFNLGIWAKGEQQFADLKQGGYVAPSTQTIAMQNWMGDWEAWDGASGHVALFTEAFWTYQGTWATKAFKKYNLDIVPYVVPAVSKADASANHHSIATIDFGGVTTSCKHPREAYELLKFMSFGQDGWKTRIQVYNNESIVNSSKLPLKEDVMPAPITTNKEIWKEYIKMYCKGMDQTHVGYWKQYFKSCMQPIPYGWTSIAGYWNFCDEYFNKLDIHNIVDTGKGKAADYADEATTKANYYHAVAMLKYFGKNGYNVLSDKEVKKYQKMEKDNK